MILCIDVGNTHIYGGLYADKKFQLQFRYPSHAPCTSDQLGIFFKSVLKENSVNPQAITKIAICSVVPALNYSIRAAFLKYFSLEPFFLQKDSLPHIKLNYRNPQEIGADRLSNLLAAIAYYPNSNVIIIDLGTATTIDILRKDQTYLGGLIMPGMAISMKALSENTANLSAVTILKPESVVGTTTSSNIQAGLYFGHVGALKEMITKIQYEILHQQSCVIIGTGGFASMFEDENIFTVIIPELVLHGLMLAAI